MALINKDAAITEIKKLSAYLDSFHEQRVIEKILSILDTLEVKEVKEEHVSKELEEAAQEYVTKEGYLAGLHYNSMVRSFKVGAEWYAHNTNQPDNLLLAARKASIDMCNIDDRHLDEYPYHPIAEQKFIEGAQWQEKKRPKDHRTCRRPCYACWHGEDERTNDERCS